VQHHALTDYPVLAKQIEAIHMSLKFKYLFLLILGTGQSGLPLPSRQCLSQPALFRREEDRILTGICESVLLRGIIADSGWFSCRRKFGSRVLNRMNRISLRPEQNSIRSAKNLFARHGAPLLLVAKFAPGFHLLHPTCRPVWYEVWIFLLLDGWVLLMVGAFLAAGRYFGDLLQVQPDTESGKHCGVTVAVAAFLMNRLPAALDDASAPCFSHRAGGT